jgi:hypothetical protein
MDLQTLRRQPGTDAEKPTESLASSYNTLRTTHAALPQPARAFCWADCLGGCSLEMSGEHLLSKAGFKGPSVNVAGLSVLRGANCRHF